MRKPHYISKLGLITYWALLPWCLSAQTPGPYTGIWEGNFMEQFKTAILLDSSDDSGYAGKILMYSGETRIQDDELSRILIEEGRISFYIAAKETSFEGTFNEEQTAFAGHLIFPDQSRHPLAVQKYNGEEETSEASGASEPSWKQDLKLNIAVDQLKSDLQDLIRKVKKYHPRLYSYTSEEAFDCMSEEISEGLIQDMTLEEYYLRIAPLIASIRCSHTGIRLPVEYQQLLNKHGKFFPLELFITGEKAYCLSVAGTPETELAPGMEILTINHRPVPRIIDTLLSVIPSEGNCMTTRYQELNRDFQHYFHMLDPSEQFDIEYASASGKGTVQLEACPWALVKQTGPVQLPDQPYGFHLEDHPKLGVLTINSFGIRNMEAYFSFLDSAFRAMKQSGTQNLVLDLRNNQGGHPIFAAQLFSYLTDGEFTYFKRNPEAADFEPLYHPMEPNESHFPGTLYVLVNGNCLSTTGHLISLLKYHTGAIFIGEEPGSTYTCNDNSVQFSLPGSGLEVNIPRSTFTTAVDGSDAKDPFPLDYEVSITVQDLLTGSDRYMTTAEELILEKTI